MKLLNKISISGIDYRVIYEKDRGTKHGFNSGGSQLDWNTKIWIDTDQSEERQRWVFIHEVFEAINSANDLNLSHQTLSTIATAMYGVIKQLT